MPKFSDRSLARLNSCDVRIQNVLKEAIKYSDFTVLCGYRNKEEQDKAYAEGNSGVKFPNSKHNVLPSIAVDIAPYPIDWADRVRFIQLAALVLEIASVQGVKLRWGGNWKTRGVSNLMDMPHFELV